MDPEHYDQIALESYEKVLLVARDLGCDGLDLDYEEFWHADNFR